MMSGAAAGPRCLTASCTLSASVRSVAKIWRMRSWFVCQRITPAIPAATVTKTATYAAISRKAVVRVKCGSSGLALASTDHVSRATDRMQQGLLEVLVDLRSEPGDVDVDDIGLRIEMIIPDVLEQHGARHDLTGMAHQVFEQAELPRLQRNRLS